ncbi:MAG: hypothetical protein C4527_26290 [Candidatus Omnitrophota bacterium]|nr:MAG: hypothetical protein C4527_26290 [Candidatus Omnitrophota bacterium]
MIDVVTVETIKKTSIEERLRIIELILQSIKIDILKNDSPQKKILHPFKVRKFSMGEEILVDREELYSERGL